MKTTTIVRPLKKGYTSTGRAITTTTHVISQGGPIGLRHSLRGSAEGKIWKKTVLGDKFEFAKKLKEKKNYILYTSGMGHEKKGFKKLNKYHNHQKKEKLLKKDKSLIIMNIMKQKISKKRKIQGYSQ